MIRNKVSLIITHITCWLIFLSLPLLFVSGFPGNRHPWWELLLMAHYWLFALLYMVLFYGNSYLLIPRLFFRKQLVAYFGILLLLLLMVYYLRPFDRLLVHSIQAELPPAQRRPPIKTDIVSLFLFVMMVALSMAIEISKRWRFTEQRAARAEAGKARAELSFLKAQINPHFLFNTLNNIYTLALTKNENTADSIMKLSNIMRYVTDDASEHFVPLESEVNCIRDYIDLQRLRLGKKVQLAFSAEGQLEHKHIAPLLFMTFVENVFKYGISNHEDSSLQIRIFAEEKTITFYSSNPVFTGRKEMERRGGVGVSNARRRLEHLYPNRHRLHIAADKGLYTVTLTLEV
ncbi:sensor histidine kinase [uncultured Chitinophaga sp.]|uniref:sensor histidine kinase n=1 Tax=uncultured Chitinophaga sp. TaxID=339340 RepID=UPI002630BAFC|nr:sensor histidine kinase [uncultured Chitinophaga sp.]